MTKIEVYGWGTALQIIRLTSRQVKDLLKNGATEEKLQELEYEAKFSTGRAGFSPEGFEILVDGNLVEPKMLQSISIAKSFDELLKGKSSYLIIEETQKGCWVSISSRKKFRPELLRLEADGLALSDGSRYTFMDLMFDGKSEFGGTEGKDVEVFVITPEGSRHVIEVKDQEW